MSNVVVIKRRVHQLGGLEKVTRNLCRAFIKDGCNVTLLTNGRQESLPGINSLSLGKRARFFRIRELLNFDKTCTDYLKKCPADVVFGLDFNTQHTHYRAGNGVHAVYLKRMGILWRGPFHKTLLSLQKQAFESPGLECLYANSAMVKNEILDHFAITADKVRVVHNGVEWQALQPSFDSWEEGRREIIKKHSKDSSAFHFLFLGSGFKRKGLKQLLCALEGCKNHSWDLLVVGKDKNENQYKRFANKLGIADRIKFLGEQSSPWLYYQWADCTVIPSLYDPFANVTVEALAMGNFIVTTLYNGGHEVLTPMTGVVTDLENLQGALIHAMKYPKTHFQAQQIRESIKHLEMDTQLETIVRGCFK